MLLHSTVTSKKQDSRHTHRFTLISGRLGLNPIGFKSVGHYPPNFVASNPIGPAIRTSDQLNPHIRYLGGFSEVSVRGYNRPRVVRNCYTTDQRVKCVNRSSSILAISLLLARAPQKGRRLPRLSRSLCIASLKLSPSRFASANLR